MSASYRLVHFTPDPFTGARMPLGAVIVGRDGSVRVTPVAHLPLDCLGNRSLQLAALRLRARLELVTTAETLPPVFGPYTTLTEAKRVPDGVDDPVAWVSALLNPALPRSDRPSKPRRPQRASLGYRFFETWQVARFVQKTFRPRSDWGAWLERHAAGLPELSHWVAGRDEVLLMEPVVPTRSSFESDLKDIAQRIGAYRYAVESAENGKNGKLIAYVTSGGHPDRRAQARETLGPFAHQVVDTDDDDDRSRFVATIQEVGASGDQQARLPEA